MKRKELERQRLYKDAAEEYLKALESIDRARQWPENLGVGKPYQVDERLEDYIAVQIGSDLRYYC